MKKKTLTVIVFCSLLLSASVIYGQKPNTKNVLIKYVQPPAKPLQENIKLYYSEVNNEASSFGISPDKEKSSIKLEGYERATSKDEADVLFKFTITSVSYESSVKKVTYKKKINDSTSVDRTGGQYEVTAYLSSSVYMRDLKNDKLLGSGAGQASQKKYTSSRFNTYNEAVYAVNEKKSAHAKKLYREMYNKRLGYFIDGINNDYGFPLKATYKPIARGKGKKHDYSDLESAYNEFSRIMEIHNNNGLTESVVKTLESCIGIWNKAIQEYQPNSRKARIGDKNVGHLYFNLATAYFVLREWGTVYEFLSKVKETKGQKSSAEIFEGKTKDLEERFLLKKELLRTNPK